MRKTLNALSWDLFIVLFLNLVFLSGCAGVFKAGTPMNVDKYYPEYLGVRIMPLVFPAALITNGKLLEKPYIHMPYDQPYGKKIVDVPEGTVITITHVVREYNVKNEIYDYVMGGIDVPGYSGFVVLGVCDGREHWPIDHCIDLGKYRILSMGKQGE